MSRIDELIAELCPDGVPHLRLSEIARIRNGRDYKHLADGDVPVYGTGGVMTRVDSAAHQGPSVLIPRKGSLDKLYYVDEPFWTVDTIFYTEINDTQMVPKFFYYFLATQHLEDLNQAGGVPSLTQTMLNALKIPVPPLEVQQEIVRVLDLFTTLEAELEAELEARQRQYAHYRDQLLTFAEGEVRWVAMGEICRVQNGHAFRSELFNAHGEGLPLIRIRDINSGLSGTYYSGNYDSRYVVHNGDIVIGMDGDFGAVRWNHGDALLNQRVCRLQDFSDSVVPAFVFYQARLTVAGIQASTQASTVKHLSSRQLEATLIPVPSVDEQARIVAILDKFDVLVNDLSIGLPAELAARRKQYEYYRDRLLTFKEAAA